ncbi:MAG: SusC/RagA family TonB-linked outer membrane protein [Muribaculaceae bacterium]|nr:SusC/RagA family TonB-linked outer membrane protein [Muribaculaceae bacterium]
MRKLFLIMMTLLACTVGMQAQTRTYRGTILDASDNEPLVGATVMPIGGGQGVAADVEGKFAITVPANVTKVQVSYVGFATQTVELHDGMTIYMQNAATALDNVVVVAYGTASKESLTGSVAVVGSQEIEDRPVTTVTAALEGNAPGVQVNNSTGTPGSSPSIRIRGFNSINGNNSPLYVVDGVTFEGDINDLNPADIESMSVLKDAASSALYGSRGANGVILITTKKAKNVGTIDVTATIRQGMYNRGLPFYDRLGINEWMQAEFDGQLNALARYGDVFSPTSGEAYDKNRELLANGGIMSLLQYNPYGGIAENGTQIGLGNDQLFDPTTGKFLGKSVLPGYTDLNWWNAVARSGYRQEYNVNASGATDKFNIFASVGYLKENGYMYLTDFDRFTARVNANFNPTKYLKFGVNFAGTQQESQYGNVESNSLNTTNNPFQAQFMAPNLPYYLHNGDGSIMRDDNGQPIWAGSINGAYWLSGTSNYAWELRENKRNLSKTSLDGNAYITAVIPYGFELTFRGQLYRDKETYYEYDNRLVGSAVGVGRLVKEFDFFKSHTFMQMLTWEHQYGLNHIDVLLDHENFNYEYSYDYFQNEYQLMDGFENNFNNFEENYYTLSGGNQTRTESYLGRLRYNFDQTYFAEASIRRDGSSRFSKDNRWGTFWSLGASWVISKEKFMHDVNWVNFLKLRAAYGTTGNDASAPYYGYQTTYGFSTALGGMNILETSVIGNTNLKWETTKTFDVALEGSLFNDRFNFSIGYFHKYNSDLLFSVNLPSSMGSLGSNGWPSYTWTNVGDMLNRGWELQFGVDIIRNKDLKWDFNIDATFLKNKIKKLPEHDLPGEGLYVGKSIYQIQTLNWAGVDQLTGQSLYEIELESPDFMYFDADGKTLYDEDAFNSYLAAAQNAAAGSNQWIYYEKDGHYYTNNTAYATSKAFDALPTVFGSFSTNLSWKGINLGLLFTYQVGGRTLDTNYRRLMATSTSNTGALHKDVLKSWTGTPAGITADSPNRIDPNGTPILDNSMSSYNNATSSRFIFSSSYLALKNLNVSYTFPKKWASAMKMKDLNIGAYIDNVFLVAKKKGMNPTYGFSGGQGLYYVPARVFAFQLQAKF